MNHQLYLMHRHKHLHTTMVMHRNFNDFKTKTMDIREYFQKEQKGFYRIIAKNLTVERRKQLYNAINEWHESELKLLGIADVVGRSELALWVEDENKIERTKTPYSNIN